LWMWSGRAFQVAGPVCYMLHVCVRDVFQNDIPAIMKLRKQLTKLTLDMDAAKAR